MGEEGGLPKGASVATLLPAVIDTPANRSAMPDADFGQWASPDDIAAMVLKWSGEEGAADGGAVGETHRPANGALLQLETEGGRTNAVVVS